MTAAIAPAVRRIAAPAAMASTAASANTPAVPRTTVSPCALNSESAG